MIMALNGPEQFTLYTGAGSGATRQMPFGFASQFVAPVLGIDEIRATGTNLFTVWIGNADAVFEILAPAFDPNASWTYPTTGQRPLLGVTTAANTAGPGLLSPLGGTNVGADAIAELVSLTLPTKIMVRMNRLNGQSGI
jgi:hypothetical protein